MAKINTPVPRPPLKTHEGGSAVVITAEKQLRRSVMANMLWEKSFYEEGEDIAKRIADLIPKVAPSKVDAIAREARSAMKLRHVPLLLARGLARDPKGKGLVSGLLENIIQRPDELAEFLAIYWKDGRQPLSAQVKKGLAAAFAKFNEYQLAKYDRDGAVKLRDALFLSHAKPKDKAQEALWKRLIEGKLETPDTWEVALSKGDKPKKGEWERLLREKKLGALALLRNLRNMTESRADKGLISEAIKNMKTDRVLPFRFISAATHAPSFEPELDKAMLSCLAGVEKLPGKTILIVDTSGSMYGLGNVSKNSDMTRVGAAGALAALAREVCKEVRIYATAGNDMTRVHSTMEIPARRGMALVSVIADGSLQKKIGGGGIFLAQCLKWIKERENSADRIIVMTDEQDCDLKAKPNTADAFGENNYLINVSSEKNGIGYGKWTHIDGWSEAVIDYIIQSEKEPETGN